VPKSSSKTGHPAANAPNATFTHVTKASPDGAVLLSANPITGILTKIAADEQAEMTGARSS
jgi:hypothetical protein